MPQLEAWKHFTGKIAKFTTGKNVETLKEIPALPPRRFAQSSGGRYDSCLAYVGFAAFYLRSTAHCMN